MAYTIYFGYLPKSSLIVDRSTNIVVDTDLANLYNFEVSQISFTQNGGASFIIPQTQHKIDHMAFACYNAFFIKTMNYDDDGVYQGYSITTYDITDISYSQATNVKITGMLSPYNLALSLNYSSGGDNTFMQWNKIKPFNTYISHGYAYDSILSSGSRARFSSNPDTDMYCKPNIKFNNDLLVYSEKLTHEIGANHGGDDARFNEICKDTLWELAYILPNVSVMSNDTPAVTQDMSFSVTKKKVNKNGFYELPYFITFRPVNSEWTWYVATSDPSPYKNLDDLFTGIVKAYEPYIVAKQIVPLPPFLLHENTTEFVINENTKQIVFNVIGTGNPYLNVSQAYGWYEHTLVPDNFVYHWGVRVAQLPELFTAYVDKTNFTNRGLLKDYSTLYSASDLADKTKNPYILAHTQELRLSDNQGNSYTYPMINLGGYDDLRFVTYASFDAGDSFIYTTIEASYLSNSIYNIYQTQDYRGLISKYNNSVMWDADLLKDYMAQNKNFYKQRELQEQQFVADQIVALEQKTIMNPTFAMGGVIGAAFMLGNALQTAQANWNRYDTGIKNQDYQLDNLQSAPDKIAGSQNDTLFYSNNRQMGIYLDFYSANSLTVDIIFNDFIKYGIYINRVVSDTDAEKYYQITNNKYDRQYLKYVSGVTKLKPDDVGSVDKYLNSYLCHDTCLKKLETMVQNGCYVFKDTNADFKPYKSDSELNIFSTYLNNNLFRGV